jgi:hypothetical protein
MIKVRLQFSWLKLSRQLLVKPPRWWMSYCYPYCSLEFNSRKEKWGKAVIPQGSKIVFVDRLGCQSWVNHWAFVWLQEKCQKLGTVIESNSRDMIQDRVWCQEGRHRRSICHLNLGTVASGCWGKNIVNNKEMKFLKNEWLQGREVLSELRSVVWEFWPSENWWRAMWVSALGQLPREAERWIRIYHLGSWC